MSAINKPYQHSFENDPQKLQYTSNLDEQIQKTQAKIQALETMMSKLMLQFTFNSQKFPKKDGWSSKAVVIYSHLSKEEKKNGFTTNALVVHTNISSHSKQEISLHMQEDINDLNVEEQYEEIPIADVIGKFKGLLLQEFKEKLKKNKEKLAQLQANYPVVTNADKFLE